MKLGIIAGNRLLPVILAQNIKKNIKDSYIVAICFKGETSSHISRYADKIYWIRVGQLEAMSEIIKQEGLRDCVMAGQISPMSIFRKRNWDRQLLSLIEETKDFRPHAIFSQIIAYLETRGVRFLDSTLYLKEYLSNGNLLNGLEPDVQLKCDIDFGVKLISRFVELDVGQTIAVKNTSAVALESLEGTDKTIRRAYSLAGRGCTILKFSKANQDLRFDVPVVGISTLKMLKRTKAASLVLENNRVLILDKEKFLSQASIWQIPVVARERCA
ncbi:MAG: UDP-2,3-diacylglucosamine diphosphatase LpxI [Candidatus Omnitrophica bacterium]|nr:UDP-2,3-diacylglucosamine diphosphatase LpxI [Candidatus Omnitrophota bacterium]